MAASVTVEIAPAPEADAATGGASGGGLLPAITAVTYGSKALFGAVSLLYLTQIAHLPVADVGTSLTLAGLVGLAAGVPAGRLCDTGRARAVFAGAVLIEAAACVALLGVRGIGQASAVACLFAVGSQVSFTARAALVAQVDPIDPSALAARLYKFGNIGFAAGTPVSGLVLAAGDAAAYRIALISASVIHVAAAAAVARVRVVALTRAEVSAAPRCSPWRDGRYLALTGLYAATSVQFAVFEFALPLWIVRETEAPRWTVAGSALASTITVALLQPLASRIVTGTRRAAWSMAASGAGAAAGCLMLAEAAGHRAAPATALVAAGALTLALAEVAQVVGAFTLGYALAPADAQGAYQGLFNLGPGLALSAGPVILSATVLRHGVAGWAGLAAALACLGLAAPALARRPAELGDQNTGRRVLDRAARRSGVRRASRRPRSTNPLIRPSSRRPAPRPRPGATRRSRG